MAVAANELQATSRELQLPCRHHAGDKAGSSAAGPAAGRDSFTPKLARFLMVSADSTVLQRTHCDDAPRAHESLGVLKALTTQQRHIGENAGVPQSLEPLILFVVN